MFDQWAELEHVQIIILYKSDCYGFFQGKGLIKREILVKMIPDKI